MSIIDEKCVTECNCCHKKTPRSYESAKKLENRINRIIGQLTGIKRMLDENRYCGDILIQISAVESALKNLGYLILDEHLKTCVTEKILDGDEAIMNETLELIKKLNG
ncbi:MAG: metal-sensing transcriptional repressor [Clostridia bacterium]|nr:metal-sensing transcriptional repressor [Clostridia bacterium]